MKAYKYIVPALMSALTLGACSDDINIVPEVTPTNVQTASISDGATVDVLLYKNIALTYSHPVVITDASAITLNGQPIEGAKADVCNLTLPVKLQPGTAYTLEVGNGALARYGNSESAPEPYTLHFNTRQAPVLDKELTNPNATEAAKKVYNTLLGFYGSKTASGTMGEVAWTSAYYDAITEAAGKAPAIIGFDYIHLASSPANWINYGNIAPVKEAWEAGAIPQLMWHWNVPRTNKRGAKYDTAVSKFMPSNVLIEGTWENGVAEADVKKLAGYLKLIQDAGIPCIFRPLHEAAGDYTYGPWFWWGAEGTDVTKALWNWLRDKLEKEYGINNLIWCWTIQTNDSGQLAEIEPMRNAYVGDDRCDFVGVDIYNNSDLWNDFNTFYQVREVVEGKKMIALSECGNLFNPDIAMENGETWLYFMQWYELISGSSNFGIKTYSPAESWQQVMNSSYVLDREAMKSLLK